MGPDEIHNRQLPISDEQRRVAYRIVVGVNEEAAVYDRPMIPWQGALVVLSPSRLLRDDEDAPDNAEVLSQLAIYVSPVVDGRAVTEWRAMADVSPGGRIEARPWPQHPDDCAPSEPCHREYLVKFIRLTDTPSQYSVEWTPVFVVVFDEMGLDQPDGAEIFVDVSLWGGPLPSPPPDLQASSVGGTGGSSQ